MSPHLTTLLWSPITGEKPPDNVNDGKGPDNMKAKADIVKYVKDSFAFGHKAVATLNESNLCNRLSRVVAARPRVCSWPPLPGSLLRSLRPDGRVSAYERHRATGKPRQIIVAAIDSVECWEATSFNELSGSRRSDFLILPSYFILCLFHRQAAGNSSRG